ncbi:zinc finger protein 692-like isoform X2 [Cyprinus carpio]|uniref:Zinc finger protein 692-like isoform X2 n=1 Tax=Cyprinus carpio TaxID=7962 RepID=A0A9Q9WKI2_CYPCA|nr:zinc finger protein 692-like isoform X2 [Cyprinus carpio]
MERQEVTTNDTEQKRKTRSEMFRENNNAGVPATPGTGNDVAVDFLHSDHGSPEDSNELTGDGPARVSIENQSPTDINEEVAVLNLTNRGTQSKSDPPETHNANKKTGTLKNIRKSTSRVILTCEFEGCDKIFSSLQYLNHHVKYQHLQQKSFICSHPTCSESFNIKKRPKEHVKLHSNQREYICEFCARAFRTSSNLIIHRRIHTREKPLQCVALPVDRKPL